MHRAINFNYKYDSEWGDRIRLIEESGFEGVFLYSQYSPGDYIDQICNSRLKIGSLHLPYKRYRNGVCEDPRYVNVLWEDRLESARYVKELIAEVEFAHRYGIGTVVMHVTGGDAPPEMGASGLTNVKKVLDVCERHSIDLCLENLRRLDYLDFVFDELKSARLKFCFDSGHANAMTKNIRTFPWSRYGPLLSYLHLNDNDGQRDRHWVPFSGTIDWAELMRAISPYASGVGMTLEVRSSEETRRQCRESEFLRMCFESVTKLERMLEA